MQSKSSLVKTQQVIWEGHSLTQERDIVFGNMLWFCTDCARSFFGDFDHREFLRRVNAK